MAAPLLQVRLTCCAFPTLPPLPPRSAHRRNDVEVVWRAASGALNEEGASQASEGHRRLGASLPGPGQQHIQPGVALAGRRRARPRVAVGAVPGVAVVPALTTAVALAPAPDRGTDRAGGGRANGIIQPVDVLQGGRGQQGTGGVCRRS